MAGLTVENPESGALAWLGLRRRDIRYRLVVLGDSVADVVSAAGGWLFDQGSAGWETAVLLTGHADDRALRILGAQSTELETALASDVRSGRIDTLVVAAGLFRRDTLVRQGVLETIGEGLTNVMLWGEDLPSEFDGLVTPVTQRLSIAARAFKKAALAAAGASSDSVGLVEIFRGVDLRTCRSADCRLVGCELTRLRHSHDDAGGPLDRFDRGGEVGVGPQLADRVLP